MGTDEAALSFKIVLAVIAFTWAMGGILDLWLWVENRPTISQWLRLHPLWFILPAVLTVVFLGLLSLHLFVRS